MDTTNPDPKHIPGEDLNLQNYQDDLDTSSSIKDPVIDHETDDPTKELGVDPKEFKQELDKYDIDEQGNGLEDMREEIEAGDDQLRDHNS